MRYCCTLGFKKANMSNHFTTINPPETNPDIWKTPKSSSFRLKEENSALISNMENRANVYHHQSIPMATVSPQFQNASPLMPQSDHHHFQDNSLHYSHNSPYNIAMSQSHLFPKERHRQIMPDVNNLHTSNREQIEWTPLHRTNVPYRSQSEYVGSSEFRLHYNYSSTEKGTSQYHSRVIPNDKRYIGSDYHNATPSPQRTHCDGGIYNPVRPTDCYRSCDYPNVNEPHMRRGPSQQSTYSSVTGTNQDILHPLLYSKEALIQEKERALTRQKFYIAQLEDEIRELNSVHNRGLSNNSKTLVVQILEYRQEVDVLRAQLSKISSKNNEFESLRIKLGETEYELQKLKEALKDMLKSSGKKSEELIVEVHGRDLELVEVKQSYSQLEEKYKEQKEKLSALKNYVADLPTAEEHNKSSNKIQYLEQENNLLKTKLMDLDRHFVGTKKTLEAQKMLVETKDKKCQELEVTVQMLQKEMDLSKSRNSSGELHISSDTANDNNQQLKIECEHLKKLVEGSWKKIKQIQEKHQAELKTLEEKHQLEADALTMHVCELQAKTELISKLKKSSEELTEQNQTLLGNSLHLKEQVKKCERYHSQDQKKMANTIVKEMYICFRELESLIQICLQHAEGKDPNIDALLGLSSTVQNLEDEEFGNVSDGLEPTHLKIQDLRKELEKLRCLIANKYAEDLGDNLNCTTH